MPSRYLYYVLTVTLLVSCGPRPEEPPKPSVHYTPQNLHDRPRVDPPPPGPSALAEVLRREVAAPGSLPDVDIERDPQDRVLVELLPAVGDFGLLAGLLTRLGATIRTRGTDRLDVWVPPSRLFALARHPMVARIGLPHRPRQSLGAVTSQGVAATWADRYHCTGSDGSGVDVAVVDVSFGGWSSTSPELGAVASDPPTGGGTHGTACSEIVFDVAPGVTVHPVKVGTVAELQAAVAQMISDNKVKVVSDSLVWNGSSFSDGTGPHCTMVDQAHQAGIVWVTSAGNHGDGTFYAGTFTDSDSDDQHEFAAGDELNEFALKNNWTVHVYLDWDAYPQTAEDYDLHLYQQQGTAWSLVKSSSTTQSGSAAPTESLSHKATADGTFGISVVKKSATTANMPIRLFIFPAPGLKMEHWQVEGSIEDSAHCQNAIAVGATPHAVYGTSSIWSASSRGPTTDGRIKPDIVAPTLVATSKINPFYGTSSAAPHVAGAIALYVDATGQGAIAASQLLLDDALASGSPDPNNIFGHGRMMLSSARCGWECKAGSTGPCTTSCGSTGSGSCNTSCTWASCTPPAEACNGQDDDCDGAADNGFDCVKGSPAVSCPASCGSTGTKACSASCAYAACVPPAEICNAKDDDCDGAADNGFDCVLNVTETCTTSCNTTGQKTCATGCVWDSCVPPAEVCDGADQDCDGAPDNGFDCAKGSAPVTCSTSCGSTGEKSCAPDCSWESCVPPAESCNGQDDDCDGTADNGFDCVLNETADCPSSCGTTGHKTCESGCSWSSCAPPAEICNGQDDDCDGAADNGFDCVKGSGLVPCTTSCGTAGQKDCTESCAWGSCQPPLEVCNQLDDDCDGEVDEEVCPEEGCSCRLGAAGGSRGALPLWLLFLLVAARLTRPRRR